MRNILVEAAEGEAENIDPATVLWAFEHSRWIFEMSEGDIVPAVVTDVDDEAMHVRFGPYTARVVPRGLRVLRSGRTEGFRGIGRTPANKLVKPGDLIEVKITTLGMVDEDGQPLSDPVVAAELEQEPLAEAALIAIENRTGRVLAMVGGYDFNRSKFNRATQAQRQLGSLFKGALYAAAIDQGYTATTTIPDEPTCYEPGPEQDPYCPENYDHSYEEAVTLRHALEKSEERASRVDDERGRSTDRGRLRRTAWLHVSDSAVPVRRARVGGINAPGSHERLFRVSQPGNSNDPVPNRADRRPSR